MAKAPKGTPAPKQDEIDEIEDTPIAVDEDVGIDDVLQELGGNDEFVFSIYRTEPRWSFVAKIPANEFDINRFAKEHGGGAYEILVFRANTKGICRRKRFNIDGAPRATIAPTPSAPQPFDMQTLLAAMMQQNAQIVSAVVSKPPPTPPAIDPAILALITQRSPASELADLIRVSRDFTPPSEDSSLLSTLTAAIATFAANQKITPPTAVGQPMPRLAPPVGAQKRGLPAPGHYGRSGAGATGPTLTPQPAAPNETRQAQAGNSAGTPPPGSPEAPPAAEMTVAEAIQAVFASVPTDPRPVPLMYAARLVHVFGPEKIAAIVRETEEGGIVDQVRAFLPPMPAGFLEAIEDFLRDQFEDEAPTDPTPAQPTALRIDNGAEQAAA